MIDRVGDTDRGAGSPGQGVNWPQKFEIGVKQNWYLAYVERVIFDIDVPPVEKMVPACLVGDHVDDLLTVNPNARHDVVQFSRY